MRLCQCFKALPLAQHVPCTTSAYRRLLVQSTLRPELWRGQNRREEKALCSQNLILRHVKCLGRTSTLQLSMRVCLKRNFRLVVYRSAVCVFIIDKFVRLQTKKALSICHSHNGALRLPPQRLIRVLIILWPLALNPWIRRVSRGFPEPHRLCALLLRALALELFGV